MIGTDPIVSVVIPCRNEVVYIEACIQSLLAQEVPSGHIEILVADGISDDGTREVLARLTAQEPRLQIVDNPDRIVSTGLNAAIRVARGEIIVRIDVHTTYAPDYLRQCLAVLQETGADNVGGPWVAQGEGYVGRAIAATFQSSFAVGGSRAHAPDYAGDVDSVYLGCWPRRVFDRIGLFDEELVRNQDDEWNFRLTRAGGRVWQSSRIRSWYRTRGSLAALFRQYMQYGYWKVRVIQKHNMPASVTHLVPAVFIATLVLLALASIVVPAARYGFGVTLAAYGCAVLAASLHTASRTGWRFLPVLPVICTCFHFSFGLGFLHGVLDFMVLRRGARQQFETLTRPSSQHETMTIDKPHHRCSQKWLKRIFDVLMAFVGLLLLSPLLGLIGLVIRLMSPGPVFYASLRVGRNGKPFKMVKFRTMMMGADAIGPLVTAGDDPRITPIGRYLRLTKLDELPTLWNVLRGDMSLVGPRPENPKSAALYTERQQRVWMLRPGITGLAALKYPHEERLLAGAADLEATYFRILQDKLALDLEYLERQSFGLDLWIIIQTLLAVLR